MNVYRNAYVTIAANTGDNANSGLYINRSILESRPCGMNFRDPNGKLVRYQWIHPGEGCEEWKSLEVRLVTTKD
jgi:hypothetical protein